ncbi:MAG: rane protein [Actinomycetota bacterium]|nr:rane protein [Actinomycetota bacterium]
MPKDAEPAEAGPQESGSKAAKKRQGRIALLVARLQKLFAFRVFQNYSTVQGPILASGLAFQAIFAIFAAVWVGFSVVGLVVAGNHQLQQPLVDVLANAVPGLIKASASSPGAIDPKQLLNAGVFGWTGAIALVGVLVTALGWLASARSAIRVIFGLPQPTTNFVLLKLKDLAIGIGFGAALIVSAALSVAGSAATTALLPLIGISSDSVLGAIVGRVVTLAVMFALDAVTLGIFFRVLSGVAIPWKRMRGAVLAGAVGLGALKVLGGALLGVPKSNPLLASFAVILGLLIFFNVVCQVILVSASWVRVGMDDRGLPIDPVAEKARREQERKDAEAARAARPRGLARLFGRRPRVTPSR